MQSFEPDFEPERASHSPCGSYRYPRHMAVAPLGQHCHCHRKGAISPEQIERLRRKRVRTQLAAQLGPLPAFV